jgi:hypothetical protein
MHDVERSCGFEVVDFFVSVKAPCWTSSAVEMFILYPYLCFLNFNGVFVVWCLCSLNSFLSEIVIGLILITYFSYCHCSHLKSAERCACGVLCMTQGHRVSIGVHGNIFLCHVDAKLNFSLFC